ncbi:unnamed protein product [Cuscuta europaea]|uniref:F-box domain-containing protein n=1 Tax=Cuscuta europaea TaxID=41803 RepID=A0A9P0ZVD7_CUSEU|nr:unnamed protein product [Cuscuta europaea]
MAAEDRISGLPGDILDHILGLLPIQDAARTSALSTAWRDVWLSLSQLIFDTNFFHHIRDRYIGQSAMLVINRILMRHNGPIRKFGFHLCIFFWASRYTKYSWVEFDDWLLYLTRNGVEELDLSFWSSAYAYELPDFLFLCPTLKKLRLHGVYVKPIKVQCIFPNVTSLCLRDISGFNMTAPELRSLKISNVTSHGILPVTLDLKPIFSLNLDNCSAKLFIKELTRLGKQGTTLDVGHLKLHLDVEDDDISAFIKLLQMCPNLYKLDIELSNKGVAITTAASLERPEIILAETCQRVHTLNISCALRGSRPEMIFFEWLVACFPMLEKVFIYQRKTFCSNTEFKNKRKLLGFVQDLQKQILLTQKKVVRFVV